MRQETLAAQTGFVGGRRSGCVFSERWSRWRPGRSYRRGIAWARAGGMKVIGMASTYDPAKLSDADAVVRRFAQISVSGDGKGLRVLVEG